MPELFGGPVPPGGFPIELATDSPPLQTPDPNFGSGPPGMIVSELKGSPQEQLDLDGFQATRKLLTQWNFRHVLMNSQLALPGAIYPYSASRARAVSARAVPFGKQTVLEDTQVPDYPWAVVTVNYKTNSGVGGPEPTGGENSIVVSESIEPTAEFIQLDHVAFEWGSDGRELNAAEAPGRIEVGFDYILKRFHVGAIPAAALTLVGKVNVAAITARTEAAFAFPAETLLFNPPSIERAHTPAGAVKWNVTYKLTYRRLGWNRYWRGDIVGEGGAGERGGFDEIKVKATGDTYKNYPTGDFQTF